MINAVPQLQALTFHIVTTGFLRGAIEFVTRKWTVQPANFSGAPERNITYLSVEEPIQRTLDGQQSCSD